MARQSIVTLLTDFGTADGYVASMKGVLLSQSPPIMPVDISHNIAPGDVLAGAFVLSQVIDYFPPGTVHVVVIDPGVGTDRRILAARYAGQTVIAPDNGLITLVDRRLGLEFIASVRNERYFLRPRVGRTFDGRDVMAPVAAALAQGLRIDQLGPVPDTYNLLDLPEPSVDGEVVAGQVLFIDRFGNCVTNICRSMIEPMARGNIHAEVFAADRSIGPLHGAFAHVPSGEPLALLNSIDLLEVAVNGGRACDALNLRVGSPVQVRHAQPGLIDLPALPVAGPRLPEPSEGRGTDAADRDVE